VWAKGEPPALGAGHQVSSILTTPTILQGNNMAYCSEDGCYRQEPCGPFCSDNGNFDKTPAPKNAKDASFKNKKK
jgi:hypothetical protein